MTTTDLLSGAPAHAGAHVGGHDVAHVGGHAVAHVGGHDVAHVGGHDVAHVGGHDVAHLDARAVAYLDARAVAYLDARAVADVGARAVADVGARAVEHLGAPTALPPPRALLREAVSLPRTGPADPQAPTTWDALRHHQARLGPRPRGGAWLVDAIEAAALTGRGGAHVPTALKWRAALGKGGPLTVAANGAESEPVSAKDATLLRQRPHLVLDGLVLAAESLGARRAVVWLHGDDDGARLALEGALAERRAAVGTGDVAPEPTVEVVSGPVHYLAGEARAIAQALAGGPALPTARRPVADPAAPQTLVQNVETLARVALVARGLVPPTTALLTVLAPWRRTVLEVPTSTTFAEVLDLVRWPSAATPKAVLLAGFGGLWARWDDVAGQAVDEAGLRRMGLALGAGIVIPLAPESCGLAETAAIAGYLAGMSARQCGPCLFGLPALAASMAQLAAGTAPRHELSRLRDDLHAVEGRGACHHPDGLTRLVASALEVFGADVEAHRRGRPCPGAGLRTVPVPRVVVP